MNGWIKRFFSSRFVKNSIWLMVLQGFNTVLPMVTVPYVTRILLPSGYGMFSIALNWVNYLQVVVEYGFAYLGARKASICDSEELQEVFSRIVTSRILLLCGTFGALNILCLVLSVSKEFYTCLVFLFLMVIGSAFQLTWLFQGKQEMKLITLVNATSRLISVALIFIFVKTEKDIFLYCFLYSCTYIFSSIFGMLIAYKRYGLVFRGVSVRSAVATLKDSWALFLSQAMARIVSGVGVTVLGFVATNSMVGVYSAIQKIPSIMLLLFSPISQALYPKSSVDFASSSRTGLRNVRKTATVVVSGFAVIATAVILLRKGIVLQAFGKDYVPYSDLIIPQCIWLLAGIVNNFLGIQVLLASGHQKEYGKAMEFAAFISVILTVALGVIGGMYSVVWAPLFVELVLTAILLWNIRKVFYMPA